MKIITKNKIKEECWNLDYELIKWLNEHLKVYLHDSESIVDLSFYKFKYKKKDYTLEEIIKRLIEITDIFLDDYFLETINNKDLNNLKNEMYDLLKLVHWHLWW